MTFLELVICICSLIVICYCALVITWDITKSKHYQNLTKKGEIE
jgi:hypothetical protein